MVTHHQREGRRMAWLKCVQPFPGDNRVFERFEALFMAMGGPREAALFGRTSDDYREHTYLISPDAAKWAPALTGEWVDAGEFRNVGWGLLIGHHDVRERLGVPPLRSGVA
jgi:hypothetical protein